MGNNSIVIELTKSQHRITKASMFRHMQTANARINRAHAQRHYGQVPDERYANLRSGSMSC
jgi:hypothetical protein